MLAKISIKTGPKNGGISYFISNRKDRKPLPAIALITDASILTSVGNDYGFAIIQISKQGDFS